MASHTVNIPQLANNKHLESLILLLSRLSLASIFWLSGQTKIDGFKLNIVNADVQLGWPSITESTFYLFEYEYALPVISSQVAAYLATAAEHLFPVMLVLGLGSRLAACGVLMMTVTIQLFVYPDAYATHLSWASLALLIILKGAGMYAIDGTKRGDEIR